MEHKEILYVIIPKIDDLQDHFNNLDPHSINDLTEIKFSIFEILREFEKHVEDKFPFKQASDVLTCKADYSREYHGSLTRYIDKTVDEIHASFSKLPGKQYQVIDERRIQDALENGSGADYGLNIFKNIGYQIKKHLLYLNGKYKNMDEKFEKLDQELDNVWLIAKFGI